MGLVVCETIDRLDQRINDRLAERLCCLSDLGFVFVAGRDGEFRTLIRRIALALSIAHCAKSFGLSMILVSMDARSRVYDLLSEFGLGSRRAMGIAFAPQHSSILAASGALDKPFRLA